MGQDTPLSADQDVLVDANIFFAIGHPSNPQYRRFRSTVQNAGVVCKLPRRVIESTSCSFWVSRLHALGSPNLCLRTNDIQQGYCEY
jgi:hypothetical protein